MALWIVAGLVWQFESDSKMPAVLSGLGFDILVICLLITSAYITGNFAGQKLGAADDGLEGVLVSVGLGLGLYALVLFALGMVGLLYQPLVTVMVGVPLLISVGKIMPLLQSKPWEREWKPINLSAIEWVAVFCLFSAGSLAFIAVLVPETFYDSLYYHDAFPLLYLIRHRIEVYPHAVHSAMPSNIDLLYVLPLAFSGDQAIKLMHFMFGVGACLWIYYLGTRYMNRKSGLFGALLWATIPGVGRMAGLGAVDMGVVFFELGATAFLLRWVFDKEKSGTLVVSAFLLGIAVGSKYTALMVGLVLTMGVLAGAWRRKSDLGANQALKAIVLFGAISLATAAPWYVFSWASTGEPLYPALSSPGSNGAHAMKNLRKDSQDKGKYSAIGIFTSLPKDILRQKGEFGAGSALGYGVIAFIPALLWGFWRKGPVAWLSGAACLLYLIWSQNVLIVRYLYPGLAIAALLAGGMLAGEKNRKLPWEILVGIFIVLVTLSDLKALAAFHESFHKGAMRYLSLPISREQYLAQAAPHFGAANFVQKNLPGDSKLLFVGETKAFYYSRDYMPISGYDVHPLESWVKAAKTGLELKTLLKEKGFTHIVLSRGEWKRLNKSYGYLTLDTEGAELFESMLGEIDSLYQDRYVEVFIL